MEWQPISTAPKDDTVIMVWDGRRHFLVRSDDFKYLPQGYWLDTVTHWMPLPPPPTQEGME